MDIKGRVIKKKYGVGTKSEREAIMLEDGKKQYLLSKQTPTPNEYEELESLVGKSICGHGTAYKQMFFLESWDEEPAEQ